MAVIPLKRKRAAQPEPTGPATVPHPRGQRERTASPWLGDSDGELPSVSFARFEALERALAALWPAETPVAPTTAFAAWFDWAMHLASSPAKQWELGQYAFEQWQRAWRIASTGAAADCCVTPMSQDKRFADPAWREPPQALLAQYFLLTERWWQRATRGVPGVSKHHEHMVSFAARQWLDLFAPSNSVFANPVVRRRTLEQGGANLWRGASYALDDLARDALDLPPAGAEGFKPGVNVAITPGQVVLRNRLIELIQYQPTTPAVHAEPILLVPAWIMKYYILDLSPRNSLVKFLVDRGYTVFVISWKNPGAEDRNLGLDDYHHLGVKAALDAVAQIVPGARTHAVGYCLGGTLLAMGAAKIGREREKALQSMTLFAAQTDFSDPGEISLFIDESQFAHLDRSMARRGTLDKRQMRNTFQLLRSRDLIWSYRTINYLLGERAPMTDLMAWNADGTRLPYRMHREYLRRLYLDNALALGDYRLDGVPINLHDIRVPSFVLAAVQDHVAPWRSVFRLNQLCDAEQTYVLTAGGHNVGVVNPPGAVPTSYRLREWRVGERILNPDEWLAQTPATSGSWWNAWADWLDRHSSPRLQPPPAIGAENLRPLQAAPGSYVLQR
ncbi:MAG: alpha/beta fold hydrolase [Burkholderiaceae bacterium]|nr:MAG: alpha/beta fold hydrolase [Burkholderiaceae bacterium]